MNTFMKLWIQDEENTMTVSSIWRRYCGSCGCQLVYPLLPLRHPANVNTVKETNNVLISLKKYFDSSDPWKCLGNPRTPWTTLWEELSWRAGHRRYSDGEGMAPAVAGVASAPSTLPSWGGAGLGHPHRLPQPTVGDVYAWGEAAPIWSLNHFSCLHNATFREWGLKVEQRLRRQQLLKQGDPAGPRVGSLLEHTPGDSWLEVLRWLWCWSLPTQPLCPTTSRNLFNSNFFLLA